MWRSGRITRLDEGHSRTSRGRLSVGWTRAAPDTARIAGVTSRRPATCGSLLGRGRQRGRYGGNVQYCANCGRTLEDGATVCDGCGTPVGAASAAGPGDVPPPPPPPPGDTPMAAGPAAWTPPGDGPAGSFPPPPPPPGAVPPPPPG